MENPMANPISAAVPVIVAPSFRPGAAALGILARCASWLRRMDEAAALREMEPHRARDIGIVPGRDRAPDGFAVDPRPLWGIGLTPQPTEVIPPWSRGGRPRWDPKRRG
jgi:uncharacterized protein YjiS (DUF1127 family)